MSKIALSGDANGNGTLTIASPNTNSDRTLTLPDSTGTIATAESTLAQFNASGSAPVYACRAWVNFNGTGDYTVNFTTAMPDANYAFTVSTINTGYGMCANNPQVTGSFRLYTVSSAGASVDFTQVAVSIFR